MHQQQDDDWKMEPIVYSEVMSVTLIDYLKISKLDDPIKVIEF
jgi:hypothetical protein